jgi:uncharacterized membrane protein YuzA (DUF378 family)
MELSRLSSIMAIFGAVNIFYAMYGLIQMDMIRTLVSTATYLILMYSSAVIDAKAEELRRSERARVLNQ